MASVTLSKVWLTEATDPTVAVSFYSSDAKDDRAVAGEVRRMANGRLRVVTRAGQAQTLGRTARSLSGAQVAQMEAWCGTVLLLRDVWGRRTFGTFFALSVSDAQDRSGQDVAFTFQQVSYDEAV